MSELDRIAYRGAALPPGVNVTSHPRCGDADRQRAIDRVSEAYARGYMEKHEAEARQEAINAATLGAHLEQLTADIPAMSRHGVSLDEKRKTGAERLVEWWMDRWPVTGLGGMVAGLTGAIAPTVTAVNLHLNVLANILSATTIPVFGILAIASFVTLVAGGMDV